MYYAGGLLRPRAAINSADELIFEFTADGFINQASSTYRKSVLFVMDPKDPFSTCIQPEVWNHNHVIEIATQTSTITWQSYTPNGAPVAMTPFIVDSDNEVLFSHYAMYPVHIQENPIVISAKYSDTPSSVDISNIVSVSCGHTLTKVTVD